MLQKSVITFSPTIMLCLIFIFNDLLFRKAIILNLIHRYIHQLLQLDILSSAFLNHSHVTLFESICWISRQRYVKPGS